MTRHCGKRDAQQPSRLGGDGQTGVSGWSLPFLKNHLVKSCSPHGIVCNLAANLCSPPPISLLSSKLRAPGVSPGRRSPPVQLRMLRNGGCREIACHGRGLLLRQLRCRPRPLFRGSFSIKMGRILQEASAHTAEESTMHRRETRSRTSSCDQPLLPCCLQEPRTPARCTKTV